jgi:hypothetical protein
VSATSVRVKQDTYAVPTERFSVSVASGQTTTATADYAAIIPDTTVVVGAATGPQVVAVSDDTVTLSAPVSAGDVLVSGIGPATPNGLLRRVTSVQSIGGNTVAATTEATIQDAISRGRMAVHTELTQGQGPQDIQAQETSQGDVTGIGLLDDQTDKAISEEPGWAVSAGCKGTTTMPSPTAHLSVSPYVDFTWSWGWLPPSLNEVDFSAGIQEQASISVQAEAGVSCNATGSHEVVSLDSLTFMVGPVPVVVSPSLDFVTALDGSFQTSASVAITQSAECHVGFTWQGGKGFHPIAGCSNSFPTKTSAELQASAEASMGPKLEFDFYGGVVQGPYGELTVGLGLEQQNRSGDLYGALDGDAGIQVGILGLDYHTNVNLLHRKVVLAKWTIPTASPSASATPKVTPRSVSASAEPTGSTTWTASSASGLASATCVSASDCWAVGTSGTYTQVIAQNAGSGWSVVSSPSSYGSGLGGVSCTSSSDCWAVGYSPNNAYDATRFGVLNIMSPLFEQYTGSEWSVVSSPQTSIPYDVAELNGVSCISSSDCWAVGDAEDTNLTAMQPLIEQYNGSVWSVVVGPNGSDPFADGSLKGVTCTSAGECWAVGETETPGSAGDIFGHVDSLIEQYAGGAWSIVSSPSVSASALHGVTSELDGVTCVSSSDCWAVGSSGEDTGSGDSEYDSYSVPLIEEYADGEWTIVSNPSYGAGGQPIAAFASLGSVACVSSSDCWAVGGMPAAPATNYQAASLIEQYTGSGWSIPSGAATGTAGLSGVSCAASSCWAVGSSEQSDAMAVRLAS